MKKLLMAGLFSSALLLNACDSGGGGAKTSAQAPVQKLKESYVVGTDANFIPFEFKGEDGQLLGFDIDIMNALAKESGFKITFKDQAFNTLFSALQNKEVDILAAGIGINDTRRQSVAFSNSYYTGTQALLIRKHTNAAISMESLKKLEKIGVVVNRNSEAIAKKLLGENSPNLVRFDDVELSKEAFLKGEVDAIISDNFTISEFTKEHDSENWQSSVLPNFEVEYTGLAVRPGDTELLKALNDALATIRQNGEYERIHQQYFLDK